MTDRDCSALAPDGRLDLGPTGSGPLDGVRVAVKDLFDVAGTVTGAGNPTLAAGPPATRDAAAVATLRRSGATVVAKTATDELAMGMFGVNSHYGTPPNPAAPSRVPGGSSSGSASMVAAGAADLGLGTDTGGSIRVPAAFCGLFGLRPTHGRIDAAGVRPMAPGFDTVGLLARDLSLLGAAFGVLSSGHRPRHVRALVLCTDLVATASEASATRTTELAEAAASALGLELRRSPLCDTDLRAVFWPLMSRELWQSNGAWAADDSPVLGDGIAERIAAAAHVTDDEVDTATGAGAELVGHLTALLDDAVAVLPTTWGPPPRRDTPLDRLLAWRDRNLTFVVAASLAGAPQLTLPAGTVDDGDGPAPIGVSLLGLPGDDELLIDTAARLVDLSAARVAGEASGD
ncbi:MAG: amidase family protein [Actinomycetota bacterium]|nr:amidase family protein [Actinomycetota bacterium]